MREIKVRLWDGKKMGPPLTVEMIANQAALLGKPIYEGQYVWLEYTGLKDRTGVEIYEGSLVRVYANAGLPAFPAPDSIQDFVVVYDRGSFVLRRPGSLGGLGNDWMITTVESVPAEVIGHIYEKSDLTPAA